MLLKSIQLTYNYFLPANVIKINNDIFSIKNIRYNLVVLQTDYTAETQSNFLHYLLTDSSLDKVLQTLNSEDGIKLTSKENLRECKIIVKYDSEKQPFKSVFFFLALLKHDLTHFIILKSELTDKQIITKNMFLADHWTKDVNAVKLYVPIQVNKETEIENKPTQTEEENITRLPTVEDENTITENDKIPIIKNTETSFKQLPEHTQVSEEKEDEPGSMEYSLYINDTMETLHKLFGNDKDLLLSNAISEYNLEIVDYETGYTLDIYDKNNHSVYYVNILIDNKLNLVVENENIPGTNTVQH